jgi:hypothetical protein
VACSGSWAITTLWRSLASFIGHFAAIELPGVQTTELTVGGASFQVAVDEARELYSELLTASETWEGSATRRLF